MDEKDRLVLTGVRVANFLNIANFDLIFLLNTHILSVCRFVGLYVYNPLPGFFLLPGHLGGFIERCS